MSTLARSRTLTEDVIDQLLALIRHLGVSRARLDSVKHAAARPPARRLPPAGDTSQPREPLS